MIFFHQKNKGLVMIFMYTILSVNVLNNCISFVESKVISWDEPIYLCGPFIPMFMSQVCQINPSSISLRTKVKRGIVDDCCKSSCTPMEMRFYCPNLSYAEAIIIPEILLYDIFDMPKTKPVFQENPKVGPRSDCHWLFKC